MFIIRLSLSGAKLKIFVLICFLDIKCSNRDHLKLCRLLFFVNFSIEKIAGLTLTVTKLNAVFFRFVFLSIGLGGVESLICDQLRPKSAYIGFFCSAIYFISNSAEWI